MKKIFCFIIIILIIISGGLVITNIIEDNKAWKVEVIIEKINVREDYSVISPKLKSVYEGSKYEILDMYLDDNIYVWYKIKVDGYTTGWIASQRNDPYVKEKNNPEGLTMDSYFIDTFKPIIKYTEEVYYAKNIDSITYDHLIIEEDSKYSITNKIYYDEFPEDGSKSQYFIKYIVTDELNNVSSKIQRISFEMNTESDEVLDISDL